MIEPPTTEELKEILHAQNERDRKLASQQPEFLKDFGPWS